jgi:ATP-dependent Clp protease ATP-binding subunit ClpA
LSKQEITQIVDLLLDLVQERLLEQNLTLLVTNAAKELIAEEGYDPDFGARPLRRVIQHKIEDSLSESILAGTCAPGDTVQADVENGEITLQVIESSLEAPIQALPEPII